MPETIFHTTFSANQFLHFRAKNGSESGLRSAVSYRFGFNGKENDNEVKGTGNQQDYGMRIYDPRLGRWLSRDPDEAKYPQWSTYNAFVCNPIIFVDPDGEGAEVTRIKDDDGKVTKIVVTANIYVYSSTLNASEMACYATAIESDIEDQWNNPVTIGNEGHWIPNNGPGTVIYLGKSVPVEFQVNVVVVTEDRAKEIFAEGNKMDNFIELTNGNEQTVFEGNTGRINVNHMDRRGSSLAAQEFGHLLGFRNSQHPEDGFDENHTSFVDEPYSIMSRPLTSDLGLNTAINQGDQDEYYRRLSKRHVTQNDISRINGGKSFSDGVPYSTKGDKKGTIGSRSSEYNSTPNAYK